MSERSAFPESPTYTDPHSIGAFLTDQHPDRLDGVVERSAER